MLGIHNCMCASDLWERHIERSGQIDISQVLVQEPVEGPTNSHALGVWDKHIGGHCLSNRVVNGVDHPTETSENGISNWITRSRLVALEISP